MQTKTQSYNMFHSKTFLHIKELDEILEDLPKGQEYWLGKEDNEPRPDGYNLEPIGGSEVQKLDK